MKEEIDQKTIGDVLSVNALFGHVEWRDRGFRKDLGGGTTLDMGIYCIQVTLFLKYGKVSLDQSLFYLAGIACLWWGKTYQSPGRGTPQ